MLKKFLQTGNERSQRTKKNIVMLFFLHAFNVATTLMLVPLSIAMLGTVTYGVWVTLSSVILWLNYLDFGIGNGLRNKVAEALASENKVLAKTYVSTAYFIFLIAALIVIIISFGVQSFFNWVEVFNAPITLKDDLQQLMMVAFALFALQIFLKLINSIINADQRPALNGLISVVLNGASIAVLGIQYLLKNNSLLVFGLISFVVPIVVLLLFSVFLFNSRYNAIKPSWEAVDFSKAQGLFSLGLQFFIIQVAGLVVFATQNLLISRIAGPADVTVYNIAFRYFSIVTLVFGVMLTPFWSAYTEAFVKGDFQWITSVLKKIILVWFVFLIGTLLMVLLSGIVYYYWVGSAIEIPFLLTALMGLYVTISNWNNIFAYFLNGVGKIKLQFYFALFVLIVNLPLSVYLMKISEIGISGVVLANCIVLLVGSVWAPLQCVKIIKGKANGIWNA